MPLLRSFAPPLPKNSSIARPRQKPLWNWCINKHRGITRVFRRHTAPFDPFTWQSCSIFLPARFPVVTVPHRNQSAALGRPRAHFAERTTLLASARGLGLLAGLLHSCCTSCPRIDRSPTFPLILAELPVPSQDILRVCLRATTRGAGAVLGCCEAPQSCTVSLACLFIAQALASCCFCD